MQHDPESGDSVALGLRRSPLHLVLQPGGGHDEERREEEPQEGVQPDQRDVEADQADADPEGAEWSVSFQGVAPEKVGVNRL